MHTKPVIDHIGNKHESIQAMCKYWGISRNTYISRMRSGNFTVERALTLPIQSFGNNIKPAIDHLGNKYPSQLELCKAYNIRTSMLINRLNSGMTMEQALTTPIQPHTKPARDHLGKEYSSQAEMCRAYKVPLDVYRGRIKRGKTLEQALTDPVQQHLKPVVDHLGKEYPSQSEMCRVYNIDQSTLSYRLKQGMSLEQALTTSVNRD